MSSFQSFSRHRAALEYSGLQAFRNRSNIRFVHSCLLACQVRLMPVWPSVTPIRSAVSTIMDLCIQHRCRRCQPRHGFCTPYPYVLIAKSGISGSGFTSGAIPYSFTSLWLPVQPESSEPYPPTGRRTLQINPGQGRSSVPVLHTGWHRCRPEDRLPAMWGFEPSPTHGWHRLPAGLDIHCARP